MWFLIIITIVSATAFLILWFYMIWREMSCLRIGLDNAKRQISLHNGLITNASSEQELCYAQSKLVLSKKLYNETVRRYNESIRKPHCFFTARLLGFKTEQQVDEV